ncbi:MAG: NADH-quinone oxidoreductase subunit NuoK [Planctomycetota bacterium]|nr:NADH-quinone oxidoreductase subunit NuoK [Planctomycetota bacterium]
MAVGLNHYLILAAFIFSLGILCMTIKRNAIGILIGVELVLNAANINLIAFSKFTDGGVAPAGQLAAVFVILIAAAEAAIAIAIFMNFYNSFQTVDVDRGDELRG